MKPSVPWKDYWEQFSVADDVITPVKGFVKETFGVDVLDPTSPKQPPKGTWKDEYGPAKFAAKQTIADLIASDPFSAAFLALPIAKLGKAGVRALEAAGAPKLANLGSQTVADVIVNISPDKLKPILEKQIGMPSRSKAARAMGGSPVDSVPPPPRPMVRQSKQPPKPDNQGLKLPGPDDKPLVDPILAPIPRSEFRPQHMKEGVPTFRKAPKGAKGKTFSDRKAEEVQQQIQGRLKKERSDQQTGGRVLDAGAYDDQVLIAPRDMLEKYYSEGGTSAETLKIVKDLVFKANTRRRKAGITEISFDDLMDAISVKPSPRYIEGESEAIGGYYKPRYSENVPAEKVPFAASSFEEIRLPYGKSYIDSPLPGKLPPGKVKGKVLQTRKSPTIAEVIANLEHELTHGLEGTRLELVERFLTPEETIERYGKPKPGITRFTGKVIANPIDERSVFEANIESVFKKSNMYGERNVARQTKYLGSQIEMNAWLHGPMRRYLHSYAVGNKLPVRPNTPENIKRILKDVVDQPGQRKLLLENHMDFATMGQSAAMPIPKSSSTALRIETGGTTEQKAYKLNRVYRQLINEYIKTLLSPSIKGKLLRDEMLMIVDKSDKRREAARRKLG